MPRSGRGPSPRHDHQAAPARPHGVEPSPAGCHPTAARSLSRPGCSRIGGADCGGRSWWRRARRRPPSSRGPLPPSTRRWRATAARRPNPAAYEEGPRRRRGRIGPRRPAWRWRPRRPKLAGPLSGSAWRAWRGAAANEARARPVEGIPRPAPSPPLRRGSWISAAADLRPRAPLTELFHGMRDGRAPPGGGGVPLRRIVPGPGCVAGASPSPSTLPRRCGARSLHGGGGRPPHRRALHSSVAWRAGDLRRGGSAPTAAACRRLAHDGAVQVVDVNGGATVPWVAAVAAGYFSAATFDDSSEESPGALLASSTGPEQNPIWSCRGGAQPSRSSKSMLLDPFKFCF